ncbi:hypothetical protein, partial [Pseudomonas sp. KCJK9016]|uniref:hypothetical protein n=1 Tax=Pseudomonas sp. KCJK9016 TaxID=3344556 RepID=UPI003905C720
NKFEGFILITSAKLSMEEQDTLKRLLQHLGYTFIKIYQGITFESLANTKNNVTLKEIRKSKKTEKISLFLGTISILSTLAILFTSFTPYIQKEKNLDARIGSVIGALNNIKSLEDQLLEIKSDMEMTQIESERIQREYEKSQTLKHLTDDQKTALRETFGISTIPWWSKPLDYILGFILGIAASVVASVIYDRMKRNKALNSPV